MDNHFKRSFRPNGKLSAACRAVKRVKTSSSAADFSRISTHEGLFGGRFALLQRIFASAHAATPSAPVKNRAGFTHQAACDRSTRRAGCCATNPICVRIRSIATRSSIMAVNLKSYHTHQIQKRLPVSFEIDLADFQMYLRTAALGR
jgi:hypothetical protein